MIATTDHDYCHIQIKKLLHWYHTTIGLHKTSVTTYPQIK